MLACLAALWNFFFRSRDADRKVFVFKVSGKTYRVDPLEALIALRDHDTFDWEKDPIAADECDGEAMARTMQAIDDVFGVKGLREGGMTLGERLALLRDFLAWCESIKKKQEPSRTSSSTSAPQPNPSPTNSEPDSICGENACCSVEVSPTASGAEHP